jgi:aldose 1-epimerase
VGFTVTTRDATAGDRSGTVYTLAGDASRAEVWPFMGFNCLRWQVRNAGGSWGDVLHSAPDWESNPVPTRSGHPVLFPFPNRLRDGRFTFEGKTYQLPLNESMGKHAIHGFTPRNPWRVVGTDTGAESAAITGQFRLSRDLPSARDLWPADFTLTLSYRLTPSILRVEAVVENPDGGPLPFGLGYHPYFCLPTAPGAPADDLTLWTPAATLWIAEDGIPTGQRTPVPPGLDFRTPRLVGGLSLDSLLTDLGHGAVSGEELAEVARLGHRTAPGQVVVAVSSTFRELLLFTPPHRKAVAIEPYTCASDGANLTARGIESGWAVLPPGMRWAASVEYRWDANTHSPVGVMPSPQPGLPTT